MPERYEAEGARIVDTFDGAGSDEVICPCGYLASDERASASHSPCPEGLLSGAARTSAIEKRAREIAQAENEAFRTFLAELDDDDPADEVLPTGCECDNTHAANNTVCRYCWAQGIRA